MSSSLNTRKRKGGESSAGSSESSKEDAEDTNNNPKTMKFQELFRHPSTKRALSSACLQHCENLEMNSPGLASKIRLRSQDSVSMSGELPRKEANELSAEDDFGKACAKELMDRWQRNKQTEMQKKQEDSDSDNSEIDDPDEFLRCTVPQWDIKRKLYALHMKSIKALTNADVEKICKSILPDLDDIIRGRVRSERDILFKSCGLSKNALRNLSVGRQFTSFQNSRIMEVISNWFHSLFKPDQINGEMLQYAAHVLGPEAIIRIFAKVTNVSWEQAEKELRFEADYDGNLSEELLKFVTERD